MSGATALGAGRAGTPVDPGTDRDPATEVDDRTRRRGLATRLLVRP